MNSKIEWTDETWNPVTGCTKVSPGCDHCYAKTMHERFNGPDSFETITLHPERLELPLRWRKPRKVFVNSMSDLFHQDIPDDYIARVWAVMATSADHTFQVLTKRHARMRSLLTSEDFRDQVADHWHRTMRLPPSRTQNWPGTWPLPNVWLGVSVETQQWADIRIPALLGTPAAVRFLSCEPLLGPVDLAAVPQPACTCNERPIRLTQDTQIPVHRQGCPALRYPWPDWVIVGGESGHGARPMHPEWARSLRDQCQSAGVPFLFKQWGAWAPRGPLRDGHPLPVDNDRTLIYNASGNRRGRAGGSLTNHLCEFSGGGCEVMELVGKGKAGRELDGRTWDEYPGDAS